MGKRCSCTQFIKSCLFYYKSRKNLYQGTTSHVYMYIMKLKVYMIEYHLFVAVGIVTRAAHS